MGRQRGFGGPLACAAAPSLDSGSLFYSPISHTQNFVVRFIVNGGWAILNVILRIRCLWRFVMGDFVVIWIL